MRTKTMIWIAAALMMAGCGNENDPSNPLNNEIRLSSGIEVQTRANGGVPDTQIAGGQQVGVFIHSAGSGSAIGSNLIYGADGNGGLTLDASQSTPYYPTDGNGSVTIIAYHPHKTGASITDEGYEFEVNSDQSNNDNKNYYDSDLLYSESKTYSKQSSAHALKFTHKLSKVLCTLTPGNGDPDLTGATVSIVNARTKVTFKPSNGDVTDPTTDENGSDVKMNSTIASGSYIAIIPPQTFAEGSQFLKITLASGGDFYYPIPADNGLTLDGGNVYKYKITVNRTELEVTSSIEGWGNDNNEYTGNAEMQ